MGVKTKYQAEIVEGVVNPYCETKTPYSFILNCLLKDLCKYVPAKLFYYNHDYNIWNTLGWA